MKIILLITLFCLPFISNGQNIYFIKSYGNNGYDYGRDIKQDVDTGYIATGSSSSFLSGNADAFLLKVDSLGNFKWSYPYGGPGADWGEAVVVTLDSSYALGGYTNSFGAGGFDFYLVRTDRTGNPIWEKTYGGTDWERAHDLIQLPDSGFVLVGETYSYGNGNMDVYIIRTDKNGDTLWTRTYGGTNDDYANAVLLDGDSLVIAGGTTSFGAGMTDGLILKYHINGTLGWAKVAGREKEDYFTGIDISSTNQYYLSGTRLYYYDQTSYLGDFWLYSISQNGNIINFDTTHSSPSHELEIAYDLVLNNIDEIYYCGSTKSFGYSTTDFYSDAYIGIMHTNLSSNTFPGVFGVWGEDKMVAIDFCYDEGSICIGNVNYSSTGGASLCIVKTDKNITGNGIQIQSELLSENITLTVKDLKSSKSIKTYPTIVENTLNIEGLPLNNTINVYDYSGQLIFSKSNINNTIDLSYLSSGSYILTIQTDEGYYSTKIIKN